MGIQRKTQNRKIRIEGKAHIVSSQVADTYFKSRPRGSQIGACLSNQSHDLVSRDKLIENIREFEIKHKDRDIPRPSHWNGYLVTPVLIEFWQDMPFRLHDRLEFRMENDGWGTRKLYP